MNFLTALKSGRPIRRRTVHSHTPWYFLGKTLEIFPEPVWRDVATGKVRGLDQYDYLAEDW